MKNKLIIALLCILSIMTVSCADKKVIKGTEYRPYGLLNEGSVKNDSIYYEASGWAIFSGVFFCQCIVPPIYVFGYNLWEPKMTMTEHNKLKSNNH